MDDGAALNPGDGLFKIQLAKPRHWKWKPRADITAHELALCMPILLTNAQQSLVHGSGAILESLIEALPPKAKRHLEEQP